MSVYKGFQALSLINSDPDYTGSGKALAAIIIGGISTVLNLLGFVGYAISS